MSTEIGRIGHPIDNATKVGLILRARHESLGFLEDDEGRAATILVQPNQIGVIGGWELERKKSTSRRLGVWKLPHEKML